MRYLALVGILCLAACSESTAPTFERTRISAPTAATNDLDLNQSVPSALVAFNPCNGDAVALTGTMHVLVHSTDARSGNTHYYSDVSNSYSGDGAPSLVKYNGTTRDRFDFTANNPFPFVQNIYNELTLKSARSVANFTLIVHIKVTFNATGVPTAEIADYTTRCGG